MNNMVVFLFTGTGIKKCDNKHLPWKDEKKLKMKRNIYSLQLKRRRLKRSVERALNKEEGI